MTTKNRRKGQPSEPTEQHKPQSLPQAYLGIVFNWHPVLRNIVLLVIGLFCLGLLMWTALPEKIKIDLLTSLSNHKAAPVESSNPQSSAPTNTNAESIPQKPQKPPLSNQPKHNDPIEKSQSPRGDEKVSEDSITGELQAKGLVEELKGAQNYAAAGNRDSQEKALQLYRSVLSRLSVKAHKQLDQGLLKDAERDYKEGNTDEATAKYRKLFATYL